jgi:hypothetical protein
MQNKNKKENEMKNKKSSLLDDVDYSDELRGFDEANSASFSPRHACIKKSFGLFTSEAHVLMGAIICSKLISSLSLVTIFS